MMRIKSNPSPDRKREVATDFAEELRDRRWEFGMCNDDLVIFVSREDKQVGLMLGVCPQSCQERSNANKTLRVSVSPLWVYGLRYLTYMHTNIYTYYKYVRIMLSHQMNTIVNKT